MEIYKYENMEYNIWKYTNTRNKKVNTFKTKIGH